MKGTDTKEKDNLELIKEIILPEKLVARIRTRNEQIQRLQEQLFYLNELNRESLNAFMDGQKFPKNATLKFDQENWKVSVLKQKGEDPVLANNQK